MKIELEKNKVFFENKGLKKEIHPFWLRERVNGDIFVDKNTQQRLFDPTGLQNNIQINSLNVLIFPLCYHNLYNNPVKIVRLHSYRKMFCHEAIYNYPSLINHLAEA